MALRSHLIVTVKERKLKFDKIRLAEMLRGLPGEKSPLKVDKLCVVGQRESGKSHLAHHLIEGITTKFKINWDPLSAPLEQESNDNSNRGDAGISFQIFSVQEKRRWIILMDVVGGDVDSTTYTRLVDFCLLTSDFVFYIEDLKQRQETTLPSWDLTRSAFYNGELSETLEYNNPSAFILVHGTGIGECGGKLSRAPTKFKHQKFIKKLAAPSYFLSYFIPNAHGLKPSRTDSESSTETPSQNSVNCLDQFIELSIEDLSYLFTLEETTGNVTCKDQSITEICDFLQNSINTLENGAEDALSSDDSIEVVKHGDETHTPPQVPQQPQSTNAQPNSIPGKSSSHSASSTNLNNSNDGLLSSDPHQGGSQHSMKTRSNNTWRQNHPGINLSSSLNTNRNKKTQKSGNKTLSTGGVGGGVSPQLASSPGKNQLFDIKAVARVAIDKCQTFLKYTMENDIFTNSEIKRFHRKAIDSVTSDEICFHLSQNLKELYINEVKTELENLQKFHILQNEQEMKGQVKERQKVLQEMVQWFEKLVGEYLMTVGPNSKYKDLICIAQKLAWRVYVEGCDRKNLDATHWTSHVHLELEKRQGSIHKRVAGEGIEKKSGQISILEHEEFMSKLEAVQHTDSSLQLAFHLTPTLLRGATPRRSSGFDINDWPLFISFEGTKTIIGTAAANARTKFDLYKLLNMSTRGVCKVLVKQEQVELLIEEVLSMFLFKVRREIESTHNVNIHSCVMVTSPFLSITAKQRLKTSLFLAGFKDTTLIHSLTAVGHASWVMAAPNSATTHLLTLHETTEGLEVSVLTVLRVLESSVHVLAVGATTERNSHSFKQIIVTTVDRSKIFFGHLIPVIIVAGYKLGVDQNRETLLTHTIRKENDLRLINWSRGYRVKEVEWILQGALHFNMLQSTTQIPAQSTSSVVLSVRYTSYWNPQEYYIQLFPVPNQNLKWTFTLHKLNQGEICEVKERNWRGEEIVVGQIQAESAVNEAQVHISPEGLLQFTSSAAEKFQFSPHYLTPEEVTLSKDKLATKYFKEKNYFDEACKLFFKSMKSVHKSNQSETCKPSLSSQKNSQDSLGTNLKNVKEKLREYMNKVEQSLLSPTDEVIGERIIEKMKQDLEQCQTFMSNFPTDAQVKDVERQLERLQISTQPLKL